MRIFKNALRQVSEKAKSWNEKIVLGGLWVEHDNAVITLHANTLKGTPVEATLTLAQAEALKTLLEVSIMQVKGAK